jgi:hypothetical protein
MMREVIMPTNRVELPWPPRELYVSSQCHWRVKASIGNDFKSAIFHLCRDAGLVVPKSGQVNLALHFFPPSGDRFMDANDCVASYRYGIDGIAEALHIKTDHLILHPDVENGACWHACVRAEVEILT